MTDPLHDPLSEEFYASAQAGNYDKRDHYWWGPYALAAFTGIFAIVTLIFLWLLLIGPR